MPRGKILPVGGRRELVAHRVEAFRSHPRVIGVHSHLQACLLVLDHFCCFVEEAPSLFALWVSPTATHKSLSFLSWPRLYCNLWFNWNRASAAATMLLVVSAPMVGTGRSCTKLPTSSRPASKDDVAGRPSVLSAALLLLPHGLLVDLELRHSLKKSTGFGIKVRDDVLP